MQKKLTKIMEAKHTNRKIPSHKTKGMLLLTVIIHLDQVHFKTDSGHHSFFSFFYIFLDPKDS